MSEWVNCSFDQILWVIDYRLNNPAYYLTLSGSIYQRVIFISVNFICTYLNYRAKLQIYYVCLATYQFGAAVGLSIIRLSLGPFQDGLECVNCCEFQLVL